MSIDVTLTGDAALAVPGILQHAERRRPIHLRQREEGVYTDVVYRVPPRDVVVFREGRLAVPRAVPAGGIDQLASVAATYLRFAVIAELPVARHTQRMDDVAPLAFAPAR